MKYNTIISIVIYLFFSLALFGLTNSITQELNEGNSCPRVLNIPLCYVIPFLIIPSLLSHIANKKHYIFFICAGIAILIALVASLMNLFEVYNCQKTLLNNTPKCYYGLAVAVSLLILKIIHISDIEKGLD